MMTANVDPGAPQNPLYIQQRYGLALGNGRVYVGFGGYAGDCGPYHGWLVSVTEDGSRQGRVRPHSAHRPRRDLGHERPVDRLGRQRVHLDREPERGRRHRRLRRERAEARRRHCNRLANFSSTNATGDTDIGSSGPALLSNKYVFEVGKQQVGLPAERVEPRRCANRSRRARARPSAAPRSTDTISTCPARSTSGGQHRHGARHDVARLGRPVDAATPATDPRGRRAVVGRLRRRHPLRAQPGDRRDASRRSRSAACPTSRRRRPRSACCSSAPTRGVTAFAGPTGLPPHAPPVPLPVDLRAAALAQRVLARRPRRRRVLVRRRAVLRIDRQPPAQPTDRRHGRDRRGPGYWLVASDGGVFAFNRPFYGSTGNIRAQPTRSSGWPRRQRARLLARRVRRRHLPRSATPRSTARPARSISTTPIVGMAPTPDRSRLLARRVRRRRLRLRRRHLPRLDGRQAVQPADRRHRADAQRARLLARRVRRRHLRLRRRHVPRLDRGDPSEGTDRRHRGDADAATATGSSRPTAASSASATPRSTGSTGAIKLDRPDRRHGPRLRRLRRARRARSNSPRGDSALGRVHLLAQVSRSSRESRRRRCRTRRPLPPRP